MTPNIDKIVEACKRLPEQRHWSTECPKQFFNMECRLNERGIKLRLYVDFSIKDSAREIAVFEAYNCIAVLLRLIDVLEGRQKLAKPEEVKQ